MLHPAFGKSDKKSDEPKNPSDIAYELLEKFNKRHKEFRSRIAILSSVITKLHDELDQAANERDEFLKSVNKPEFVEILLKMHQSQVSNMSSITDFASGNLNDAQLNAAWLAASVSAVAHSLELDEELRKFNDFKKIFIEKTEKIKNVVQQILSKENERTDLWHEIQNSEHENVESILSALKKYDADSKVNTDADESDLPKEPITPLMDSKKRKQGLDDAPAEKSVAENDSAVTTPAKRTYCGLKKGFLLSK